MKKFGEKYSEKYFKKFSGMFQIFILTVSIISFSVIMNASFVDAQDGLNPSGLSGEGSGITGADFDSAGKLITKKTPGSAPNIAGAGNSVARVEGAGELAATKAQIFADAPPGVTKDVFFGGENYNVVVKDVYGVDTAQLPNGQFVEYKGGEWVGAQGAGGAANTVAPYTFWGTSGGMAYLLEGAVWGAGLYFGIQLLGGLLGLDESLTDSLSLGALGGVMTYSTISSLGPAGFQVLEAGNPLLGAAPWIGIGVGVAIFIATYKKEKKELIVFECLPWEAPLGGNNCAKCNEDPLIPCSEYRCKSLGQACEIVNPGTEEELCIWVSKEDTSAPHITEWDEALSEGLEYSPDNKVSPPNRGFNILRRPDGCLEALTPFQFGFTTNEPAHCKSDLEPKNTFDEMEFLVGETNLFSTEHIQTLVVPSPFTETGDVPNIAEDGSYTLWVRCIDANGNGQASAMVAFSFCVDPGPDLREPQIVGSDPTSGGYAAFESDSVFATIYTNELAECKWSQSDMDYDAMGNTMDCATESYQITRDLTYSCSTTLTGIKDREVNDFFFRCRDLPGKPENERNTMRTSFPLILSGTEPLVIDSVGPTGEFLGSETLVEVILAAETTFGADQGKSICSITETPEIESSYEPMFSDSDFTFSHTQTLYLDAGEYTYHFRCIDAGGNRAESSTSFSVKIDDEFPSISRVFRDGSGLRVITNEPAQCVYSLNGCDYEFSEGLEMPKEDPETSTSHYAEWNLEDTYYIKCADLQGNEPFPTQCSIIAKGSEL